MRSICDGGDGLWFALSSGFSIKKKSGFADCLWLLMVVEVVLMDTSGSCCYGLSFFFGMEFDFGMGFDCG